MSKIRDLEEQIMAFVLKQQEKSGKRHSISQADFQNNLAEVDANSVNDALYGLEFKGLVMVEWERRFIQPYAFSTVSLTLAGWLQYSSFILKIDPWDDAEAIAAYIRAHTSILFDKVIADTKLSDLRFWFAIEQLKSREKITYDHKKPPVTFTWIGD